MWTWLASLITGPLLQSAIDAYKAKLAAGNTAEKVEADLVARELEVQAKEREIDANVLIAEQGSWFTRWVRPLWAAPFVIWTWKVVVWDKVLGWGTTDELSGMIGTLCITISACYFGGRSLETIARGLRR